MTHLDTAYVELLTQSKRAVLPLHRRMDELVRHGHSTLEGGPDGSCSLQLHFEELREKLAVKLSPSIAVKEPWTQQSSNGVDSIGIFHNFTV